MSREFKLPELGEGVEAGDVLKVLVGVGDAVDVDQAVLELETDKATIEVPVPFGGTVTEIQVKEGDKVNVGQVIMIVEVSEGASMPEAKAAKLVVPPKEASAETASPVAAPPKPAKKEEPVTPPPHPPSLPGSGVAPAVSPSQMNSREVVPAAPSVRRIARELGVDITHVTGTGPGKRIVMEDVKEHARQIVSRIEAGGTTHGRGQGPLPDFEKWGAIERQSMSNVRRKTAEHLTQSWAAPHVTNHDLADITGLETLRKRYAGKAEASGGKLTMTAIALKFVAAALKVFPQFNASVDMGKEEIVLKKYIHVGVAVDTERGLLVPVIRDADRKNIVELSVELSELAEKARSRKLGLEDMQGGTFTITNLGGIGGTAFTPIINWPEVAILGLSRGRKEPVFVDGQFVPRLMLPLSLTYDHRLIDGADAARFLRWLAEAFENPFLLSLEG
jgi:pyruvate dehydrogenase E2 component (dihydrolipoamide acetyltransferase)